MTKAYSASVSGDVQQEVVAARDHEDADGLRQRAGPVAEGLDVLARWRADAHRDERLHAAPERLERDVGVIAADDAGGPQRADTLRRRRRRGVDRGREVAVGLPCIVLEGAHQGVVECIKFGHGGILADVVRICPSNPAVQLRWRSMTGQTAERCVIVLDADLAPGLAANAAAVLAVTLGATVEGLAGPDLVDADGDVHPGLFEKGLPVLGAERDRLPELRARALGVGVGVIDIPAVGQQTNDYDDVRAHVRRTATADLEYLGLALHGSRRAVSRVTGTLPLLGRSSRSASRAA